MVVNFVRDLAEEAERSQHYDTPVQSTRFRPIIIVLLLVGGGSNLEQNWCRLLGLLWYM